MLLNSSKKSNVPLAGRFGFEPRMVILPNEYDDNHVNYAKRNNDEELTSNEKRKEN